ncbi:MAG: PspC domain-containing protein [Ornithinimicrobium sp.]
MSTIPGPSRPPLARPVRGRVIAGVAAGLAEHLGLRLGLVRVVLVLLVGVSGAGIAVYVFFWGLLPEADGSGAAPTANTRGQADRPLGVDPSPGRARGAMGRAGWLMIAGLSVIAVGVAAALGASVDTGFWLPVLLLSVGAVFVWAQLDGNLHDSSEVSGRLGRGRAVARVLFGVALSVTGLVLLSTRGQGLAQLWDTVIPVLVVLLGVVFIMTPYAARLWRELRSEQTARVRATERADIAAHLHDSVLQTLTLIQRRSADPQVTRLARAQERELRQWLFAGVADQPATLGSAAAEAANEVEDRHGIPIDLVLTGDGPLTAQAAALVAALREALVNAAAHGKPPISAYVEVGPSNVAAYVRDRGAGFSPEEVPPDRQGVRESIIGRMQRHGGSAEVRRVDVGTEIALNMPLGEGNTAPSTTGSPADSPTHDASEVLP